MRDRRIRPQDCDNGPNRVNKSHPELEKRSLRRLRYHQANFPVLNFESAVNTDARQPITSLPGACTPDRFGR